MDPTNLTKPSATTIPAGGGLSSSTSTPTKAMNGVGNGTLGEKMAPPPASVAPRLEIQPYHEALKAALSKENWMTYTETLNKFLRGWFGTRVGGGCT